MECNSFFFFNPSIKDIQLNPLTFPHKFANYPPLLDSFQDYLSKPSRASKASREGTYKGACMGWCWCKHPRNLKRLNKQVSLLMTFRVNPVCPGKALRKTDCSTTGAEEPWLRHLNQPFMMTESRWALACVIKKKKTLHSGQEFRFHLGMTRSCHVLEPGH